MQWLCTIMLRIGIMMVICRTHLIATSIGSTACVCTVSSTSAVVLQPLVGTGCSAEHPLFHFTSWNAVHKSRNVFVLISSQSAACNGVWGGDLQLDNEAPSPNDQAAQEACDEAQEIYDSCWDRIWPATVFLSFAWLASWVAATVPLFMMCCCTENPHEV
jgi:hypothetical protein